MPEQPRGPPINHILHSIPALPPRPHARPVAHGPPPVTNTLWLARLSLRDLRVTLAHGPPCRRYLDRCHSRIRTPIHHTAQCHNAPANRLLWRSALAASIGPHVACSGGRDPHRRGAGPGAPRRYPILGTYRLETATRSCLPARSPPAPRFPGA